MTKHKYDPTQVTIEIDGEVLHNVVSTIEFVGRPEIYSTQSLQIESLCEYARSLGYVPRDVEMIGRGFELVCHNDYHSSKNISFQDMVQLHDCEGFYPTGIIRASYTNRKLKLPVAKMQFAAHNKLVDNVKLQRDKKSYGGIKCQSNMIKLTDKGKEFCAQFPRYDILFDKE